MAINNIASQEELDQINSNLTNFIIAETVLSEMVNVPANGGANSPFTPPQTPSGYKLLYKSITNTNSATILAVRIGSNNIVALRNLLNSQSQGQASITFIFVRDI